MVKTLAKVFGESSTPRADVALALTVGAFAGLLLWEAEKIPPPFFDPLGSAAVPQGVASILAVLAAVVLLRAVAAMPWPRTTRPEGYRPRLDIALGIALVAIGYVTVMELEVLSFQVATIAFVILASALLGRFQPRVIGIGAAVAVAVGIGGAYLFTNVFFIALP